MPTALEKLDIPVVADVPGVGANLQDHLETYVQHACTQPITLYSTQNLLAMGAIGARMAAVRAPASARTNHFESGGFIRSRAGVEHPDLQYHFLPIAITYDGKEKVDQHGFQAHVGPMRATSRGTITLASANPRDAPRILFNYLATEGDRQEFRDAIRLTREIFAQKAFDPYRGAGALARARRHDRRRDRRPHPAQGRERLPSVVLVQDGRGRRSRWPWSTAACASAAPRACASSTRRSCRRW